MSAKSPSLLFLLISLLVCAALLVPVAPAVSDPGAYDLLGTRPPAWHLESWIGSPALDLQDLRGKVVLVRWWTGPGCPFCRESAPALNRLHHDFEDRGLRVIGAYHHKARRPLDPDQVTALARELGFEFPVAIDPRWRTLREWWLDGGERRWTSVSFLLDREGRIRHVHPGGSYPLGSEDYRELRATIEGLLAD